MKELFVSLLVVALLLFVYFIPTIFASREHHRAAGAIFVINLFLGWTFLGWVIALAWAANGNIETPPKQQNTLR